MDLLYYIRSGLVYFFVLITIIFAFIMINYGAIKLMFFVFDLFKIPNPMIIFTESILRIIGGTKDGK